MLCSKKMCTGMIYNTEFIFKICYCWHNKLAVNRFCMYRPLYNLMKFYVGNKSILPAGVHINMSFLQY